MKPSKGILLILFSSMLLLVWVSSASSDDVNWYTVDGGGAMFSTGGSYSLGGTIGQPDAQAAPVMSGGTYELIGGFWPVADVCYCLGDMNGDGLRDGRDIQLFVTCVLGGGDCSCADVNQTNGVDLNDVAAFVADLLAGQNCP
jgi:hypothetical protein